MERDKLSGTSIASETTIHIMKTQKNIFNDRIFLHICNKSISNFQIFAQSPDATRFLQALDYYRKPKAGVSLSGAINKSDYVPNALLLPSGNQIMIYAYCIMPDHYHALISGTSIKSVSQYVNNIENSFTRYFNVSHNRKGPLWQSPYRHIRITQSNIFLHVSRYIHLNPTTAFLTTQPEDWHYSSYRELVNDPRLLKSMLPYAIRNHDVYRQFVTARIDYQRRLRIIKKALLDD
jgi:putative transposase